MARPPSFGSALREGVVIFVGVLVALVADDWRTERADVHQAESSLRVIVNDLALDSMELGTVRDEALVHESATRWIFENRHLRDPDPDSVQQALTQLQYFPGFRLSRAGYEGLRASNRLDLIIDDDLRQSLVRYYEVLQPDIDEYAEIVYERRETLLVNMYPFVERQSFPNDSLAFGRVGLRGAWSELVSDPVVIEQVGRYGESAWALRRQLNWMQRRTTDLMDLVRQHLDDG